MNEGRKWWQQPELEQGKSALQGSAPKKWYQEVLGEDRVTGRLTRVVHEVGMEGGKEAYYTYLKRTQSDPIAFPTSDAPYNSLLNGDKGEIEFYPFYEKELKDYSVHRSGAASDKVDAPGSGEFYGNKLHLNIEPKDVVAVSKYLKQERFWHKYLSGGEIEDGKIFTIYVGSAVLTKKLAQKISQDLKLYLRKPVEKGEVEYAPNVIGRFSGSRKNYEQYGAGLRGVSILRSWGERIGPWTPQDEKRRLLPLAFDATYNAMADEYGEYFYGKVSTST